MFFTILVAILLRGSEVENVEDGGNSTLDIAMVASVLLCVAVPFVLTVYFKARQALQSLPGADLKSSVDRVQLGMASKDDKEQLLSLIERWGEEMRGGREGSNMSFDGCVNFSQKFFIASFPGIYEGVWQEMTSGVHAGLLSVACVFFQDGSSINGRHCDVDLDGIADDEDSNQDCHCEFLWNNAPGQQKFEARDGKPGWVGNCPPWGCMWFSMWSYHVLAMAEAGQQAVVIRQSSNPINDHVRQEKVTGQHLGLGNAQKGEVQFLREKGIPIYYYDIHDYRELVHLALRNQPVPDSHRSGEVEGGTADATREIEFANPLQSER